MSRLDQIYSSNRNLYKLYHLPMLSFYTTTSIAMCKSKKVRLEDWPFFFFTSSSMDFSSFHYALKPIFLCLSKSNLWYVSFWIKWDNIDKWLVTPLVIIYTGAKEKNLFMDEKEKEKTYGSSKFSIEYLSKLFPDHSCKTRLVQIALYYAAYHIKKNSLFFSTL